MEKNIYKKALQDNLRFETPKGVLTTEQLFSLGMEDLDIACRKAAAVVKKEQTVDDSLAFLEGKDNSDSLAVLRFEILKDVYLTKKEDRERVILDEDKKKQRALIASIIAKKRNEKLESMTIEELESLLNEQ